MVAPNSKKAIRAQRLIAAAEQEALGFKNAMFGEMYIHAVKQSVEGNNDFLRFIKGLREAPVDIETFLDSPEFMGATDLKLWPEVRKLIVNSCQNWWKGEAHGAYKEILLTGSTSSGKSECCKVVTAYFLHVLGCMKSPQTFYNLPSSTSIVIPIQAAKPHVTKKIIYMPLRTYVDTMPWFRRNMRPNKLIEAEMYFEGVNVRVVQGGADSDAILGDAVIAAVVDEINFMNVVQKSKRADVASGGRSGTYDQAQSVYEALIRRRTSRFITRGPQVGMMCISSSRRYKNDFTDRRQQQVEQNEERGIYIYDKAQYEARPASFYCGEKFRVAVFNNAAMDIRILEETDKEPRGAEIFDVPIEYYDDFVKSPSGSVRDVLGRSVNSISPFFKKRNSILDAIQRGKDKQLESIVVKDNVILGIEGMPAVKRGVYCQNPSKPRYAHIDLSVTGDSCVAAGSPILLNSGSYRPIEFVRRGDVVVSADGSARSVVQRIDQGRKEVFSVDVTGWFENYEYTCDHRMLSVKRSAISYKNGTLIKPTHKMFSRKQKKSAAKRYNYVPEYRELGELSAGDFLATPRPEIAQLYEHNGVPLCEDTGYLVGIFAAEGSYYEHRQREYVQFSLHKDECEIEDRLSIILAKHFGLTTRVCEKTRSAAMTIRTTASDRLVNFLYDMCGEYSSNKKISTALSGNREYHKGVLHGVIAGDGYTTKNSVSLKTVSRRLATDVYWCLAAYGFAPWVYCEEAHTPERDGIPRKAAYTVMVSGPAQVKMFKEFSPGIANPKSSRVIGLDNYLLYPINSISPAGTSAVYDLTVADASSFVVGNTGVHNCGIAVIRYDGMVDKQRNTGEIEKLPKATIELAVGITPDHGAEIDLAEVRAWVKQLKDIYGYPIKAVSYDGFASIESRQQWKKVGMKTGLVSVDRSSVPYKNLRDAFYDGRIDMYEQPTLVDELYNLEYDGKSGKDGKVDHQATSTKDVADAVCGAYQTLLTRASTWIAGFEGDRYNSHMDRRADVSEMERYGEERPE